MKQIKLTETNEHSDFIGDVLKLVGGTAFAQALTVLVSPILTRLYSPEAFGVSALYITIVGVLSVIASLRYQLAIMLPEEEDEAANILALSLIVVFLVSILTVPLIWFDSQPVLHALGAPELGQYLWIIPLSVFMNGIFQALYYWVLRNRQFNSISAAMIISSIVIVVLQLGLGVTGHISGGSLIAASIAAITASTLALSGLIFKRYIYVILNNLSIKSILRNIKRYKRFPIFDTWAAILDTISLPTILLYPFFSSTIVGYYYLASRVLAFPITMIGSAVSQVFFQRIAKAKVEGNLANVAEEAFKNLAILGVMPFLVLSLIGKDAFIVVFGSNWAEAGVYVQILAIYMMFVFLYAPISTLFTVLEEQRAFLIINILNVSVGAITLVIGGLMNNPIISLSLYSFGKTIIAVGYCLWILQKAGVPIKRVINDLGQYFIYALPTIIVLSFAKWVLHLNSQVILIIGSFILIIYYLFVLKNNERIKYYFIYPIVRKYKYDWILRFL